MKIKILKIVIPLLLVLLIQNELSAQGAKSKKPGSTDKNGNERVNTEESVESDNKTESSTENYDVDQTEKKMENYSKGEPIELYDLIYMLLPDEGDDRGVSEWSKVKNIKLINWTDKFGDEDKGFLENGEVSLTTGKKAFKDKWNISVHGGKNGYSILSITYFWNSSEDFEYGYDDLERLFNTQTITSKILERDEGLTGGWVLYEIKFSDKKVFWMKVDTTDSGNRVYVFDITVYIDKNEIDKY